jgi:serine/threonine protein kinase
MGEDSSSGHHNPLPLKSGNRVLSSVWEEAVDGLFIVFQQGMIHRDLKPVNIFLDSDDHVKIGDFGLATDHLAFTVSCLFVCLFVCFILN